jgi:uncharacterized protein YrrD
MHCLFIPEKRLLLNVICSFYRQAVISVVKSRRNAVISSLKQYQGYSIHATDGNIGKVSQFFFDDNAWLVRYLVVDTGGWLTGRLVLIPPQVLGEADRSGQFLSVQLTKDQIADSPGVDTDQPVSRQHEIDMYDYYGWPYYWAPGVGTPSVLLGLEMAGVGGRGKDPDQHSDPHLRSTREVAGYHIQARDGDVGHVKDFLVDDQSWKLLYLVVDTGGWLSDRKVLISPNWVEEINWPEHGVRVGLKRETIQNSPLYIEDSLIDEAYQSNLDAYYQHKLH